MTAETQPYVAPLSLPASQTGGRQALSRIGFLVVALALLSALATFLLLSGLTPFTPTNRATLIVVLTNVLLLVILLAFVTVEFLKLRRAYRQGLAGARLHGRMVRWFGFIAGLPAILVAVVASLTLTRGLDDWLNQPIKLLIGQSVDIANRYRDSHCNMLGREGRLMVSDLERAKVMFDADRALFKQYLTNRATFLGFPVAAMLTATGEVIERVDIRPIAELKMPSQDDFRAARETGEGLCLVADSASVITGLIPMDAYGEGLLFVARRIDPEALAFPARAQQGVALYEALERLKPAVAGAFVTMYGLISLIVLFSAVWMGLSFANSLVAPVRRLIQATDQVASGNYYVQVPTHAGEGDLAHLGATFNKMTSELRRQHDRLSAATDLIDRRRRFTEAVLAGVSVGVVGLDAEGRVTVANPPAEKILHASIGELWGKPLAERIPSLAELLAEIADGRHRVAQRQISLMLGGRERQIDVRVTSEQEAGAEKGFVVTLDDITDLVIAQRSSAWADVARRIAHEIKNPLTPIQLSAERIRRRYGKVITEDRQTFDQCTDTIIRQVDDIRRMVDEFSSFARMPKPVLEPTDIVDVIRQVVFLLRVGNPDIDYVEQMPAAPLYALLDRRLIGQVLTNLIKNAGESIAEVPPETRGRGRIVVVAQPGPANDTVSVDIFDNGKGFPAQNRQRLLEPYMTTREGGTGLGLAIVGKILEDHAGTIELLDNPEGRGAHVRIVLPAALEMPAVSHPINDMPKA